MSRFTKEFIMEPAEKEGVNFIRLMFTDLFGTIKNVEVPVSQLKKALNHKLVLFQLWLGLKQDID